MTHLLLAALFLVTLLAPVLGLDLSLATGLSVKNLLLYGVLIALLMETAILRNRRLELPDVIVPFAALIGYCLLSWLVVGLILEFEPYDLRASLVLLKATLGDSLLVFLVYFYGPTTAGRAISLLRWMICVILASNIISVLYALDIIDVGLATRDGDGRLQGVLINPNEYGALVALFLPAALALYASSKGMMRTFALAGVFASSLALPMAGSRGALAGVFIGVVAGCVLLRRYISRLQLLKAAIPGAALLLTVLVVLFSTEFGDMLAGRLSEQSTGTMANISSGRTEFWGLAFARMLEHPITFVTGFGWNVYESSRWFWAAPHSLYLNLLFNTGLIGLTLFLLAGGNVVRLAGKALRQGEQDKSKYFVATVFGVLCVLGAMFFSDLFPVMFYLWAFSGTAMRLVLSSRTRHGAESQVLRNGNSRATSPMPSSPAPGR